MAPNKNIGTVIKSYKSRFMASVNAENIDGIKHPINISGLLLLLNLLF